MPRVPRSRPREEITRAVHRLQAEAAEQLTVADLARLSGASPSKLTRWIIQGDRGLALDGVKVPGRGWCSTAAAVARFLAELAWRESAAEWERAWPPGWVAEHSPGGCVPGDARGGVAWEPAA